MTRLEKIRGALQALQPSLLEITDDSAAHAGHAGAVSGRGHFKLKITASVFKGLTPIDQHRRIYEALGELMHTDIHALAIETRAAEEK